MEIFFCTDLKGGRKLSKTKMAAKQSLERCLDQKEKRALWPESVLDACQQWEKILVWVK